MGLDKDDGEVLFPGTVIFGKNIGPWTLEQAAALAPTLGALVSIAKEGGVGEVLLKYMDLFDPLSGDKEESYRRAFDSAKTDVARILPELIPKALPYAPTVIAASTHPILYDATGRILGVDPAGIAEAGKLDLGKAAEIMLAIIVNNIDYLKNYFGPARQAKAS